MEKLLIFFCLIFLSSCNDPQPLDIPKKLDIKSLSHLNIAKICKFGIILKSCDEDWDRFYFIFNSKLELSGQVNATEEYFAIDWIQEDSIIFTGFYDKMDQKMNEERNPNQLANHLNFLLKNNIGKQAGKYKINFILKESKFYRASGYMNLAFDTFRIDSKSFKITFLEKGHPEEYELSNFGYGCGCNCYRVIQRTDSFSEVRDIDSSSYKYLTKVYSDIIDLYKK